MESTLELKSTLRPKLDLNHIPELVLVPELFILELKLTILPSHILLLDQGIDHYDSRWYSKIGHRDNFNVRILHDPIQSRGCGNVNRIEVTKGGFLKTPHYSDWQQRLAQSNHHWNHRLEVTFFLPFILFHTLCIHSYIEDNAWDRCGGGF